MQVARSMDFLLEIIRLLSEPPGNIIYHLITLLALQVVFAMSYSRWRRDDNDLLAQRLMWASAAIFLGRVLLLLAGLFYNQEPQKAAAILPPLEQAANTATVLLLVWSLIPSPKRWPRLWDILLIVSLVLITILYLFFAQEWAEQIDSGVAYYGGTPQAIVWGIIQISVLIAGMISLLLDSGKREPLAAIILSILLFAAIINLWNYAEFIPTDTNVPYWTRFGYLLAFPLWAIFAYQHYLSPILISESAYEDSVTRFGAALDGAAEVIVTRQRERRILKSLDMATHLLDAAFVSIGVVDRRNTQRINFSSNSIDAYSSTVKQWAIDLSRHPTLNAAIHQGQTVELLATGLGARQLHEFYNAYGSDPLGPLMIHPLVKNGSNIGLLVIAAKPNQEEWAADLKSLLPGLAAFISQAITNTSVKAVQYAAVPPTPMPREANETVPSAILLDQVRLSSLQAERDELKSALEEAVARRKQAEEKALVIQKQARYLAAALRAAQQAKNDEVANQIQFDADILNTRESRSASEESNEP